MTTTKRTFHPIPKRAGLVHQTGETEPTNVGAEAAANNDQDQESKGQAEERQTEPNAWPRETKPVATNGRLFIVPIWRCWQHLKRSPRTLLLTSFLFTGVVVWLACAYVFPFGRWVAIHWQAGEARVLTYHFDVGHGSRASMFVTQYYDGKAIVIEYPGGDVSKPAVYALSDLSTTKDIVSPLVLLETTTGNKPEKPDLMVRIDGKPVAYRLSNLGDRFGPSLAATPGRTNT
jgi:hypothetical protein